MSDKNTKTKWLNIRVSDRNSEVRIREIEGKFYTTLFPNSRTVGHSLSNIAANSATPAFMASFSVVQYPRAVRISSVQDIREAQKMRRERLSKQESSHAK